MTKNEAVDRKRPGQRSANNAVTPLPLSRAAGCGTGSRGELFERSEFLPRRFCILATGVVSAAGLHFFWSFFGASKKRTPPGEGTTLFSVPTPHPNGGRPGLSPLTTYVDYWCIPALEPYLTEKDC